MLIKQKPSAIQACLQKLDILISARQAPEIQVESPIPAIEISQEKLLTKRKEPPTTPKQPQPKRVKRGIREYVNFYRHAFILPINS